MQPFTLKATGDDCSRSIIVAFHNAWFEPIQKKAFSVFFRKKAPMKFQPDCVYAYTTAPVSALIARMSVLDVHPWTLNKRLALRGSHC